MLLDFREFHRSPFSLADLCAQDRLGHPLAPRVEVFHLCFLSVLDALGHLGILEILGDLCFQGTPGFLSYQVHLVLLGFL